MVAEAARRRRPSEVPQEAAGNLAVCSCWLCGNPRRFGMEPTGQEQRPAIRDRDWDG